MVDYSLKTLRHFERGNITRSEFSNGAVFLHHKTARTKGVVVSVWFVAGSRDEKKDEHGLAHLLEHMMFKGGSAIKGTELLTLMESMGGELNAYTTKEYVCFDLSCLASDLPKILPLFLDLIFSPSFNQDEFHKEKNVVLQEIREDRDNHELEAEEKVFSKSFPVDLGHPIAGNIKSVSSFTIKKLTHFYEEHFVPHKMVISMVGDNKADKYSKLLSEVFTRYRLTKKHKPYRRKMLTGIGSINQFREVMKKDTENPYLFLTCKTGPIDCDYRADFMILNHYLGEGMSSRFFKALREDEGLVYGITSYINNFSDNGSMVMGLTAREKNINKIQVKIKDIFADVALNGIGEERLIACKRQILSSWEMSFDDMDEINQHMGRGELYRSHILSFKEISKIVKEVTDERIKFVTQSMLESGFSSLILK
ncbi:MAG: M16 family metallopeptidase [Bacteriovoracaceae bacterium]